MASVKQTRPLSLYLLTACLLFLAPGALYGGAALLADTNGSPMGMPAEWLQGTIFPSFFIPGLFLFFVFGVGTVILLYALWRRPSVMLFARWTQPTHAYWAWGATLLLGLALIVWIAIQYVVIQHFHPLQVIIATLGLVILLLDVQPGLRRYYAE